MDFKKLLTPSNLKKFAMVNVGTLLMTLGLHFFTVPSKLATGGAAGFSLLVYTVTGIPMPLIFLIVNVLLIIIAIATIGMTFGALTVYSSLVSSLFLAVLEELVPMKTPITDDLLIVLIFGILIQATGISIVLNAGASTGGTDILGKIIEKYTSFSFGNGLMICDGLITLGACIVYGPKIGMYGLLGTMMHSTAVDKFISGFNSKYHVTIISENLEPINQFILIDLHRGSTIYAAIGGFSYQERKILTTVVDRREYIKLHNFVKKFDEKAFLFVYNVYEIEGEGFTYKRKINS